jgi:probable rRNA maturation factor
MSYQILVKSRFKKPTASHIIKVAEQHLKDRNAAEGIFEVELVSKNKIQEINRKFRNLDKPTDVLSFPAAEFPAEQRLYGTIFLSCDIIKLHAKNDGKTFQAEFDFILNHGLDHLLGIHHK